MTMEKINQLVDSLDETDLRRFLRSLLIAIEQGDMEDAQATVNEWQS